MVILTRFNLPSKGFESIVRSGEQWLHDRVKLFEQYCWPSVQAQTDQDFHWIVYFDPQSPGWLNRKIDSWQSYERFHPVFREEVSLADKRGDIAGVAGPPRQRLITTNLDNDDGLARDFVARVKAAPAGDPRCAIFLENGLILNHDRVFLRRDKQNAFCSVSESWSDPITCWAYPHNELSHHMPWVGIGGSPGWLQVVHGSNVSNRVRGQRISPSPFKPDFVSLDEAREPEPAEQAIEIFVNGPARTTREVVRATAKHAVVSVLGRNGIDRAKMLWDRLRRRLRIP